MLTLKLYLLEKYPIKWNVDAKPDHLLHSLDEYNIPPHTPKQTHCWNAWES